MPVGVSKKEITSAPNYEEVSATQFENTIEYMTLSHVRTGAFLDFMDEDSIRMQDDWIYEFVNQDKAYPVTNGVYYSNNRFMAPTIINASVQLIPQRDNYVKNLLNYQGEDYILQISVNGDPYVAYCRIGSQRSRITQSVLKEYSFDIMFTTKFMKTYPLIWSVSNDSNINVDETTVAQYDESTDVYDTATYGKTVETTDTSYNAFIENPDYEDLYFDIQVVPQDSVNPITFTINNNIVISYNNPGLNNTLRIINIPSRVSVMVNNSINSDVLPVSNDSNFAFNMVQAYNTISVTNVSSITGTVYEMVNVI